MERNWNEAAEHFEAGESIRQEQAGSDGDAECTPKDSTCSVPTERKRNAGEIKRSNCPSDHPISNEKTSKSLRMDRTSNCNTKKMRLEAESIHANSQKILRETEKTSFAAEVAVQKPVSSIIEKIRQRRIQLAPKVVKPSASSSCSVEGANINGFGGGDCDVNMTTDGSKQSNGNDVAVAKSTSQFIPDKCANIGDVSHEPNNDSSDGVRPREEPEVDNVGTISQAYKFIDDSLEVIRPREDPEDDSAGMTSQANKDNVCQTSPHTSFRMPMMDSLDLYPDSQPLSQSTSDMPMAGDAAAVPTERARVKLHIDTETQDGAFRRVFEDKSEWRKDSSDSQDEELWSSVGHVRQLVDDEAEDEDEDDGPADDEDENGDGADDLHDLLAEAPRESEADRERRSSLHSKWLEQQDLAVEDGILNRLESGWKTKGRGLPSMLNERPRASVVIKAIPKSGDRRRRVEQLFSFESSKSLNSSKEKPKDFDMRESETGGSQTESGLLEHLDIEPAACSDDEEAEGKLRRQLILEESEEQTEFLCVTEDESSRDVFTLINKVNVTTEKPRSSAAYTDARMAGTSHSHLSLLQHQSSFLKRKVTTTLTTRQGSGVSRSYVFGRDDSNSKHSNSANDRAKPLLQAEKESSCSSAGSNVTAGSRSRPQRSTNVGKQITEDEKNPSAPSLFEFLKQQAATLETSNATAKLKGSSSTANDLASFLAIRPPKRVTSSRGK